MGKVATMPQSKGRNASASRLNPRKMIQKSFFSTVPSGILYEPVAGQHLHKQKRRLLMSPPLKLSLAQRLPITAERCWDGNRYNLQDGHRTVAVGALQVLPASQIAVQFRFNLPAHNGLPQAHSARDLVFIDDD